MTFDNEFEIDKMIENNPKAELVLRIAAESHSLLNFSSKFGAFLPEAKYLVRLCKKKNANLIGCAFHVGSGCLEFSAYDNALAAVKEIFEFAATLGYDLKVVDMGGGWPGADTGDNLPEPENKEDELHPEQHKSGIVEIPPFSAFAEHVSKLLDKHFKDPKYEIAAEPGRYFATEAVIQACSVIAKRPIYRSPMPEGQGPDKTEMPKDAIVGWKYYVSDGVYGSMNNALTDHVRPVARVLFFCEP